MAKKIEVIIVNSLPEEYVAQPMHDQAGNVTGYRAAWKPF